MATSEPWEWTETDLAHLLGQSESARREFTESALLDGPNDKIARDLTRDVSAFANTEGGVLIIGVAERVSGKMHVASHIDTGADRTVWSSERLQRLIEDNLSPHLPGIRVREIELSRSPGRVAFVVSVPKGSTAYQAKDRLYYTRSEFERKPMADHEIRWRMLQGRVPRATVLVEDVRVHTLSTKNTYRAREIAEVEEDLTREWNPKTAQRLKELKEATALTTDELEFSLAIENVGELTIKDGELVLVFETDLRVVDPKGAVATPRRPLRYRFLSATTSFKHLGKTMEAPPPKLFPGDTQSLPIGQWIVQLPVPNHPERDTHWLTWRLYLDDAQPCAGRYDLVTLAQGAPRSTQDS